MSQTFAEAGLKDPEREREREIERKKEWEQCWQQLICGHHQHGRRESDYP